MEQRTLDVLVFRSQPNSASGSIWVHFMQGDNGYHESTWHIASIRLFEDVGEVISVHTYAAEQYDEHIDPDDLLQHSKALNFVHMVLKTLIQDKSVGIARVRAVVTECIGASGEILADHSGKWVALIDNQDVSIETWQHIQQCLEGDSQRSIHSEPVREIPF